jgi:hypothetical protein
MERFIYNTNHIKEQFIKRYGHYKHQVDIIFNRLINTLETRTPKDWRFTESPTSRFFIIDLETSAKFLGLSYRHGKLTPAIVKQIEENCHQPDILYRRLGSFVKDYIEEVNMSNLPIVHVIKTVYGKKNAEIGEEKRLFKEVQQNLFHIIPVKAKKIASRPNAVIKEDGSLWVRQYLNWIGMEKGSKEYYLFQPLTSSGIDKNQYSICQFTENGDIRMFPVKQISCDMPSVAEIKADIFEENNVSSNIRAENYWHVPTFLDRRFIDLEFQARKNELKKPEDIVQYHFIKIIIKSARERMY